MNPAKLKAIYATLCDHFKLLPEEIARLTDRQIQQIFFHPRTKEGVIEPVATFKDPKSLEEAMRTLDVLAANLGLSEKNVKEQREAIRRKWTKKSSSESVTN